MRNGVCYFTAISYSSVIMQIIFDNINFDCGFKRFAVSRSRLRPLRRVMTPLILEYQTIGFSFL